MTASVAEAGLFGETNKALLNVAVNALNSVIICRTERQPTELKRCADEANSVVSAAVATPTVPPATPPPFSPPSASASPDQTLPPLADFMQTVYERLHPSHLTVVASLIYVERFRQRMPQTARGTAATPYCIFLAALMVADKFLNDNKTFRTKAVADATDGLFTVHQVNRMEATFMVHLRYRLLITAADIDAFVGENQLATAC
ncbi:hypothetical protein H4R34_005300 [Dimargaris verticillata]|uniref:Cyclin N-terminal domain-containing protein n=1 Tax=Dimargaris verticillata TaxID=2761393 RepID=A0A9W8B2M0_9FUNG|nr:hypothetical protein H4R34_005300 [Dimargaris verticillata]